MDYAPRWLLVFFIILNVAGGLASAELPVVEREFNWNKAYFFNFYDVWPAKNGDVWIVGSKGMICAWDSAVRKWVIQESGYSRNLYGVTFSNTATGWITGQNGTILHTDDKGKSWTGQQSGTQEHLFGLHFVDVNTGWAVGAYGTILHTANGGKTWQMQGDQVDRIYNDVFFTDADHGWIVGEFGVILHTANGGRTWAEQDNPLGEKTLFSVYFKNPSAGLACGMDGTILSTNNGGTTWRPIDSPAKENLFSVTIQGENQWTVGLKGTFAKQSDGRWQDATEKIPTRAWLKKCAFLDARSGWIVGSVGTVLHTKDGGDTWMPAGQIAW